jgi:hypothetical protein
MSGIGFGNRRTYFNPTKETHATINGKAIIGYNGRIDSSTPTSIDTVDTGVSQLGRLVNEGVEYLNIQDCEDLQDVDLSSLDGCQTLQGIRVFRCWNQGTLKRLVLPSGCPSLVEVTMESIFSFGHPIDLSVLDGSPNLQYLRLCNSGRFILPSKCPSLEVLNLTNAAVDEWRLEECPGLKLVMLVSLGPEKFHVQTLRGTPGVFYGGPMTLDLEPLLRHYMSSERPPIIYISDKHGFRLEHNVTDYDRLPETVKNRIIQYTCSEYGAFLQVGRKTGEKARRSRFYRREYWKISTLYGEEVPSIRAFLGKLQDKDDIDCCRV